jgi:hypothetical protein
MKTTKVTAPTYNETKNEPILASDFGIATGLLCSASAKTVDGISAKSTCVWLRSA